MAANRCVGMWRENRVKGVSISQFGLYMILKRAWFQSSMGAKNSAGSNATCGRLVCDLQISAKELIRCRSYDLTELVSHVLKEKRNEVDPDQIRTFYK